MNYSFLELKKFSKQYIPSVNDYRIAVLGDSATQMLSMALKGMGVVNNININIFDADYNQIKLQVFDSDSELYNFKPNCVLIFMCTQKLFEEFCSYNGNREKFANEKFSEIKNIHQNLYSTAGVNIIQTTFSVENDNIFGNFGLKLKSSFVYQITKLNMLLMEHASDNSYLYLLDMNNIKYNIRKQFYDEKMYFSSKIAISLNALPEVAYNAISIIKSLKGIQKKCLICDLDNTLWGGVIGDDGIDNIEIGDLGSGHAYAEFQMWIKELKRRGIIICICSKNEEYIAREVFEKHPDMILKLEDIAVFMANWEDKASNIKKIQEILNIGMDSIVFIDDNKFERDLVKNLIPEITVPDMPEDASCYCKYLKSLNLFETASVSKNDENRTMQYKQEFERNKLKLNNNDIESYLKSLEMIADYGDFKKQYFSRISQLTQRSNQFNLRTKRYSEFDIERISRDDNYITLYFTLKDKFGEYGLVSVVILEKKESNLFIDSLLMSCRVLKRGMEEFIFNKIIDTAKNNGYKVIEAEYIPTPKNNMVSELYSKFGFEKIGSNYYKIICDSYEYKSNFITDIKCIKDMEK